MKLREGHAARVAYVHDTGDGKPYRGTMPAPVAEEIVQRGEPAVEGGELVAGSYRFDLADFEPDEWDADTEEFAAVQADGGPDGDGPQGEDG